MGAVLLVSRVGDELSTMRDKAGLSRKVLGELAGLSPGTIQLIEAGDTAQPEPETLRRLSTGLATNRATGKVDEAVARDIYESFMTAAGYAPPAAGGAADPSLESAISSLVRSRERAAALAAFVRKYPSMSADQRRLVDALIDHLGDE